MFRNMVNSSIYLKGGLYAHCINYIQVTRSCSQSLKVSYISQCTCYTGNSTHLLFCSLPPSKVPPLLMFLLLLQYIGEDDLWKLSTLFPSKMIGRWVMGKDVRRVTQLSIRGFPSIAKPFMHSSIHPFIHRYCRSKH